MKLYIILTIFLTFGAALSPFAVFLPDFSGKNQTVKTAETASKEEKENQATETVRVLRTSSGKVVEKELSDYVKGAVSAEISPEYEKEAIKAQAVVCYTYALWLKKNADNANLKNADISDDANKHQGYLDDDELREKWGDKYEVYSQKINECIADVAGKYLEYDGEPIMACFHAISTGKTESAETVWGNDVPYLKSVTANGDLLSPNIDSSVALSDQQFKECAEKLEGVKLSKNSSKWLGEIKTAKSGFVLSMTICSKAFSGNDIRRAFSLNSPAFTAERTESGFVFKVKGYGHLVGMSQYSADYMARQGSAYDEILLHFFKGASLKLQTRPSH